VLAVFLLMRPFDCFSGGKFDQKAAECCKKGKCSPSTKDDCCKAILPGGNQVVRAESNYVSAPVFLAVSVEVPKPLAPRFAADRLIEITQPPGSPPNLRLNLPLLI
jgi:hypothetical protein